MRKSRKNGEALFVVIRNTFEPPPSFVPWAKVGDLVFWDFDITRHYNLIRESDGESVFIAPQRQGVPYDHKDFDKSWKPYHPFEGVIANQGDEVFEIRRVSISKRYEGEVTHCKRCPNVMKDCRSCTGDRYYCQLDNCEIKNPDGEIPTTCKLPNFISNNEVNVTRNKLNPTKNNSRMPWEID